MRHLLALVLLGLLSSPALAQDGTAEADTSRSEVLLGDSARDLDEFLWIKRPIVVFADSPADPRFVQQMDFITDRLHELELRDVVVLTDTDPAARSALRQRLHPRGFMLVLIGKDGTIFLRKPLPWDVREISRTIDKMPLRQQEIRDSNNAS